MSKFLTTLNFSSPTWDLFIFLFFVVFSLLYGFSLGRDRIIAIIISIYMALAVVSAAPFLTSLEGRTVQVAIGPYFAFRVTLFLGVFLLIFFFLSRSAVMGTLGGADGQGRLWEVILFSFLHVGLLISVTLSFLPRFITDQFAFLTRTVFLSEIGKFVWVVLPIAAMVLVRRPRLDRGYR